MKNKYLLVATLSFALLSCGEAKVDDNKDLETPANKTEKTEEVSEENAEEPKEEVAYKPVVTEKSVYSAYLTDKLIEEIGKSSSADMYEGGTPDKIDVHVVKFTPPGWDFELAYCDVKFHKGEVRKKVSVVFVPDAEGVINGQNYGVIAEQDDACQVCELIEINQTEDEIVFGNFIDLTNPDNIFSKKMDYNFQEMYVSWMDMESK